jgi:deoxyribodipyrimidine photo-lyase
MKTSLVIYWSRRDFRLHDNPALLQALEYSKKEQIECLPIYIFDKEYIEDTKHNVSYPRRKLLYELVECYARKFERFWLFQQKPSEVFKQLSEEFDLTVYCNDDIEPYSRYRDHEVKEVVEKHQGTFHRVSDIMTIPLTTRSQSDTIYTVFSPFRNAVWDEFVSNDPQSKADVATMNKLTYTLPSLGFEFAPEEYHTQMKWLLSEDWVFFIQDTCYDILEYHESLPDLDQWSVDEDEVLDVVGDFVTNKVSQYNSSRDNLEIQGTSKLSYALKWGLVSPRYITKKIISQYDTSDNKGAYTYVSELIWREFYKYVLYHYPHVLHTEYLEKRRNLDWVSGKEADKRFESWISGETGFEIVDAAMKQIASIGWMHNRTRMIVASVLSKNLGIDWRWGQEYFRACLVDLDEASNNGGWQWSASVGVDPKPIRIFNPFTQQKKFDKNNVYISKWLGQRDEIETIVDYKATRQEALQRYGLA